MSDYMQLENKDRGPYMTCYPSGQRYYPFDPRPEECSIIDIAHHTSYICRFNGACKRFYSVAEHELLVSYITPDEHKLAALVHDAGEAYTGDVIRPIKHELGEVNELCQRNQAVIYLSLGLDKEPSVVKESDTVVLGVELEVLKNADVESYEGDFGQHAMRVAQKSPWYSYLKAQLRNGIGQPAQVFRVYTREFARLKQERQAAQYAPPGVWR